MGRLRVRISGWKPLASLLLTYSLLFLLSTPASAILVDKKAVTTNVGQTATFRAYTPGCTVTIKLTLENPQLATVSPQETGPVRDQKVTVAGLKPGRTSIIAAWKGVGTNPCGDGSLAIPVEVVGESTPPPSGSEGLAPGLTSLVPESDPSYQLQTTAPYLSRREERIEKRKEMLKETKERLKERLGRQQVGTPAGQGEVTGSATGSHEREADQLIARLGERLRQAEGEGKREQPAPAPAVAGGKSMSEDLGIKLEGGEAVLRMAQQLAQILGLHFNQKDWERSERDRKYRKWLEEHTPKAYYKVDEGLEIRRLEACAMWLVFAWRAAENNLKLPVPEECKDLSPDAGYFVVLGALALVAEELAQEKQGQDVPEQEAGEKRPAPDASGEGGGGQAGAEGVSGGVEPGGEPGSGQSAGSDKPSAGVPGGEQSVDAN